MAGGPASRARATARSLVGRSYPLSKRVAMARLARRPQPPTVVFSMGKTGSTAVARAISTATGTPVFQVFRLDAAPLRAAEQRYRDRAAHGSRAIGFPGAAHLWESEYLLAHPPTPAAPWTVITTVREPVAQAVSAFFHSLRQSALRETGAPDAYLPPDSVEALVERFVAERWIRAPLRWFAREFEPALRLDALHEPFDAGAGFGTVHSASMRLLILRQEDFVTAPSVLAEFVGRREPIPIERRNEAATGTNATTYRRFLDAARIPDSLLDEAYESEYAQHFYANAQIARFRRQWSRAAVSGSDPGP